jgi:hypothetical protein
MSALLAFADRRSRVAAAMPYIRRRHLASRLKQLAQDKIMSRTRLAFAGAGLIGLLAGTGAAIVFALPLQASQSGPKLWTLTATAQQPPSSTICGVPVPVPSKLPPSTIGPVVYAISPCFERQANQSRVPIQTYISDIQLKPSRPSTGVWTPYDAEAERVIFQDFQRLWHNHELADLSIEVRDYMFSNGVLGKLVTYDIIEKN